MNSSSKFTNREIVALTLSVVIIVIGLVYWFRQITSVFELLQLAYEYSVFNIFMRLLLTVIGVGILIALVTVVQKQLNKSH
jgi:hypothetical protein